MEDEVEEDLFGGGDSVVNIPAPRVDRAISFAPDQAETSI
jgi:hypothetical protein